MKVTLGEPDGQVSLTLPLTIVDAPISYELPETGGMGTTSFYIVGSIMVAAAVALLAIKKRIGAEG
jgi:LPXTG-motif cell wall-anchored protein